MPEDYVTRAEYLQFCKNVNGSLNRIEKAVNDLQSGTINKTVAIIISLITAVAGSGWGVVITILVTRHH